MRAASTQCHPRYTLIDLGALDGGTVSEAIAINSLNQVVGWSNLGSVWQNDRRVDKSSFRHGFVWTGGQLCDLNAEDGINIRLPRGINDAGVVVGNLFPLGAASCSFCVRADGSRMERLPGVHRAEAINGQGCIAGICIDENDTMQTVLVCPGNGSTVGTLRPMELEAGMSGGSVRALNDRNEAVGYAMQGRCADPEIKQAVLWSADGLGRALFTGAEARTPSVATGINGLGQVVGYRDTPHRMQREARVAFLYTGSSLIDLPMLPGAKQSEALGINNAAQVVGISGNRAFVWSLAAGAADLNALVSPESGWTLTRANAINASGAIVGQGLFRGQRRAFLALPVAPMAVENSPTWQ